MGIRPLSAPIDPLTADAQGVCLHQGATANTTSPYPLISQQTWLHHHKPGLIGLPLSLVRRAGVTPQLLCATRLSDLTQCLDPRVVAEALDITHTAALHYVLGAVQCEDIAFGDTWDS